MEPAALFDISNKFVLLPWLLLVLLPRWAWTEKIIFQAWIPILLGVAYCYAFFQGFPSPEGGGFGSLAAVEILFTSQWLVVAGWIHYLVFDLFVGCWEVRDSQRRGIHHLLVVPCLILTFMAGPAGLLLYLVIRAATTKTLSTVEAV